MPIVTCPKCGAKNRVDPTAATEWQPICGRCGTALPAEAAGGKPVNLTDATFEQFLADAGDRPVLVDCWAEWCGPCRMLAPTIDQLAAEAKGRYVVAKLDTDANRQTASRFRIDSIPTLLIFRNGQLADRLVGLQPKPTIAAKLLRA